MYLLCTFKMLEERATQIDYGTGTKSCIGFIASLAETVISLCSVIDFTKSNCNILEATCTFAQRQCSYYWAVQCTIDIYAKESVHFCMKGKNFYSHLYTFAYFKGSLAKIKSINQNHLITTVAMQCLGILVLSLQSQLEDKVTYSKNLESQLSQR